MGTKMMFYFENDLPLTRRLVWGRLFGSCIENVRETGGRSVEEAAHLAGMEASEWAAIEAGYVPESTARLRSMAGALELGYEKIAGLACLCRGAWEQ
jgi:transcriptional regulator with XRE-family HTH domain